MGETRPLNSKLSDILRELIHLSYIFPEDSDETVTFTAGGTNNTFGDWAEIVDSGANTLSSKFANRASHLSAILIESADTRDKVYIMEIARSDAKTPVATHRFISGETVKLPPIQQIRIRPETVPKGETIYYRMKCETASATCTVSCRYHYH